MKNQNLSSISELMISVKAWKMRFDYAVNYILFKLLSLKEFDQKTVFDFKCYENLFLEFLPMVDCWPGPDFCSERPEIWPELPPTVPGWGKSRPDNKSRPPTSSPNGERPDMSRPCSHILCFWNSKKTIKHNGIHENRSENIHYLEGRQGILITR